MICQRCLSRLRSRKLAAASPSLRTFATSYPKCAQTVSAQTTTATNPRPNDVPAATSTSAAQPFSTPLTPSPSPELLQQQQQRPEKSPPRVKSMVPAGTALKGLNFMKNKTDPVAMEDDEYPAWLWRVLDRQDEAGSDAAKPDEGDLFSKSQKQRRRAAKALKRQHLLDPEAAAPKIPLQEQTVDLPQGDGSLAGAKAAGAAREELTKAMRAKRRKDIKEANFLKSMG